MKKLMLCMATLAVLFAGSCMFPDYQLNWTISDPQLSNNNSTVTVNYTLTNTGSKDLNGATIQIEVVPPTASGLASQSGWTSRVNIGKYGSKQGSIVFNFTSAMNPDPTVNVLGAGWDAEDDSSSF